MATRWLAGVDNERRVDITRLPTLSVYVIGLVEELDCQRRVVLAGPLALHGGSQPDDVGELDLHVADVHPLVLCADLDRRFVHMGALIDHAGHHREQVRVELLVKVVPARVGH
jgi:hypothetical protein